MIKKVLKKILIGLAVLIVVIQFFRIDKTNPITPIEKGFIEINQPPTEITAILKTSCYDCHSNQVSYPWYTNIAPISWFIKDHINEAREELNFSEWADYSLKRKDHKLEECAEEVEEGEMPLDSYFIMHSEAELTHEQRETLENYFKSLRK